MPCPTSFTVSYRDNAGETVTARNCSPVDAIWEIGRTLDAQTLGRSILSLQMLLAVREEMEERHRESDKIRVDSLLAAI